MQDCSSSIATRKGRAAAMVIIYKHTSSSSAAARVELKKGVPIEILLLRYSGISIIKCASTSDTRRLPMKTQVKPMFGMLRILSKVSSTTIHFMGCNNTHPLSLSSVPFTPTLGLTDRCSNRRNMTEDRDTEAGFAAPQSIATGRLSEKSGLVFRSNAAAAASGGDSWDEDPSTKIATTTVDLNEDDSKDDREENDPITLPESTHTLLFTEPINSIPFCWALMIAAGSFLCLILALLDNPWGNFQNRIPANVIPPVRISQYCSIFIALLMEEEIPTALYLLRRIPKKYFNAKFPELKYSKFVFSCALRIVSGYLFLLNVLLILVLSSGVLEIFYDVLALQFLQQLDDIAFNLSRMSVLSKRMKDATTCKYFQMEFNKSKFGQGRKLSILLKGMYFINLFGLLAGMVYVTVRQQAGFYTCPEITAILPDKLWEKSIVRWPDSGIEEMVLNYPYFNGVYRQEGFHDSRPVYVEMNKFNGEPFATEVPGETLALGIGASAKLGAKFMYCKRLKAWVFTHEYIRKSRHDDDDSDCPWLLRSMETDVYDIEDVEGEWQIWVSHSLFCQHPVLLRSFRSSTHNTFHFIGWGH
jgi:hypothetical protein